MTGDGLARQERPFGTWPSPVEAGIVAAAARRYGNLQASAAGLTWIESRPEEGGRSTLMRHHDGRTMELTPAPANVRSRVHEYGGGAYCIGGDAAYFVSFADQNIYAMPLDGGAVRQVTHGDDGERFGDLAWDGAALLAVRERHGDGEPVNDLVRVAVATGEVSLLHSGHDFYAAPRPSADGRLAFLVWDHPNMPWDGTQLVVAEDDGTALDNATVVAGGAAESIAQPTWHGERLLFAADPGGYWNLHAYDESGVYCVLPEAAEYAGPAWVLASTYFAPLGPDHLIARRVADGEQSLVAVDIPRGLATPVDDACASYADVVATDGGVAFIAGFADQPPGIAELTLRGGRRRTVATTPAPVPAAALAKPTAIAFETADGDVAHAFVYPPHSAEYAGLAGELPPLLVTTHGGPTSATDSALSWLVQFYASRGWAVADVNYRGSTGYGRTYREGLRGAWGVGDVADCVACVRHLVAEGRADPARVAIRGGSAGGYTTLAALAFADVFRAGASHYGIGDLNALARDTHKFESRYLEALVGDAVDERSPINHVDRLRCPVVFFQGSEDKIVPPNQAEAMRDALQRRGIDVEYVLFEGEGHGFRKAENVRRAIETEYAFFCRVFGIGNGS